jgi:hypothetical protein
MSPSKKEDKEFLFPMEMVDQIYELSGGAESYKGLILCICTQNGTPQIFTRFDSVVTSLGLKKALDEYLCNQETEIT